MPHERKHRQRQFKANAIHGFQREHVVTFEECKLEKRLRLLNLAFIGILCSGLHAMLHPGSVEARR